MITARSSSPCDWALPRSAPGEAHGRLLSSRTHTRTHTRTRVRACLGHTRPGASPHHTIKVLDAAPWHGALLASSPFPLPLPSPSPPPCSGSPTEDRKLRPGLSGGAGGLEGPAGRERGRARGEKKKVNSLALRRALPSPRRVPRPPRPGGGQGRKL